MTPPSERRPATRFSLSARVCVTCAAGFVLLVPLVPPSRVPTAVLGASVLSLLAGLDVLARPHFEGSANRWFAVAALIAAATSAGLAVIGVRPLYFIGVGVLVFLVAGAMLRTSFRRSTTRRAMRSD